VAYQDATSAAQQPRLPLSSCCPHDVLCVDLPTHCMPCSLLGWLQVAMCQV
jgi:hypothetical protein